jgi:hypothetical protein
VLGSVFVIFSLAAEAEILKVCKMEKLKSVE